MFEGTISAGKISIEQLREEEMEAYRIDRFGSVDGIVLRSSRIRDPGRRRS